MDQSIEQDLSADICVIGGGSGGLSVAAGAAQMGVSVVLFERGLMGGDCLNYGCVPSKAMLAAGHAAALSRKAGHFGISLPVADVDFGKVNSHVRDVIAGIEPHDSVERFEALGVRVIRAQAAFTDSRTVSGGGFRLRARRFVIATGSGALIPPIRGLDSTPFLTNETIFDLTKRPDHLLIVGGGPIGCELAEAHRNLGADVTLIEAARLLGNEDEEAAEVVRAHLKEIGVTLLEGGAVKQTSGSGDSIRISVELNSVEQEIEGSHLLIAAGRRPNIHGLGLEAADQIWCRYRGRCRSQTTTGRSCHRRYRWRLIHPCRRLSRGCRDPQFLFRMPVKADTKRTEGHLHIRNLPMSVCSRRGPRTA